MRDSIDIGGGPPVGSDRPIGTPKGKGPAGTTGSMTPLRELTEADLGQLAEPKACKQPALVKLRASHHLVARLIAEGKRGPEVSAVTGYSLNRISILQGDPAFAELVASYREGVQLTYFGVHERIAAIGVQAAEEILDRMEEAPESFSNAQLKDLMETCLDRTVLPKKGGVPGVQVNITNNADRDLAAEVAKVFGTAQATVAGGGPTAPAPLLIDQSAHTLTLEDLLDGHQDQAGEQGEAAQGPGSAKRAEDPPGEVG